MRNAGNYIREQRKAAGHTLRGFANKMSVDPSFVSQVELGKIPVPKAKVEAILSLLPDMCAAELANRIELDKTILKLDDGASHEIAIVLKRSLSEAALNDREMKLMIKMLNNREADDEKNVADDVE